MAGLEVPTKSFNLGEIDDQTSFYCTYMNHIIALEGNPKVQTDEQGSPWRTQSKQQMLTIKTRQLLNKTLCSKLFKPNRAEFNQTYNQVCPHQEILS